MYCIECVIVQGWCENVFGNLGKEQDPGNDDSRGDRADENDRVNRTIAEGCLCFYTANGARNLGQAEMRN